MEPVTLVRAACRRADVWPGRWAVQAAGGAAADLAELRLRDGAAVVDVPFFKDVDDAYRVVRERFLYPILHRPRVLGGEPHLEGQTQ
eukprot:scaffold120466_cov33-Phaeocystis_antarctica.AAC.1